MSFNAYEYFNNFIDLKQTPIYNLLTNLTQIWTQARQGRYHVMLGYVNWATYDFDNHPLGVTLMTADETLLTPMTTLTLSMELMARMPQPVRKDGVEGIEPLISAAMKADILWVMEQLRNVRYQGSNDNVVMRIVNESGMAVDIADMERKLQGVAFSCEIQI